MIDYTKAANESDRYAREGGPNISPFHRRLESDPVAAHRHYEAVSSLLESWGAPTTLTDSEKAVNAARTSAQAEQERVEGRVLFPRTSRHINPHD